MYVKTPKQAALACIIWMHGLGSDAENMMGLVSALPFDLPVCHIFLEAPVRPITLNNGMPMRAWYDLLGMRLNASEDTLGIQQSNALIQNVIEQQVQQGFLPQQIFLAGFSQGGAMALYTGLHSRLPLGGIISLSAYLPLASSCELHLDKKTPLFIALGNHDPIVLPDWTKRCISMLQSQGYQGITCKEYAMEHMVCNQEIQDVSSWLTTTILSAVSPGVMP